MSNTPDTRKCLYVLSFSTHNHNAFKDLITLSLSNLFDSLNDARALFDVFHDTLVSAYHESFPLGKFNKNLSN